MCLAIDSTSIFLPHTGQHIWSGQYSSGSGRVVFEVEEILVELRKTRSLGNNEESQ